MVAVPIVVTPAVTSPQTRSMKALSSSRRKVTRELGTQRGSPSMIATLDSLRPGMMRDMIACIASSTVAKSAGATSGTVVSRPASESRPSLATTGTPVMIERAASTAV